MIEIILLVNIMHKKTHRSGFSDRRRSRTFTNFHSYNITKTAGFFSIIFHIIICFNQRVSNLLVVIIILYLYVFWKTYKTKFYPSFSFSCKRLPIPPHGHIFKELFSIGGRTRTSKDYSVSLKRDLFHPQPQVLRVYHRSEELISPLPYISCHVFTLTTIQI